MMAPRKPKWIGVHVSEEAARLLLSRIQSDVDLYPNEKLAPGDEPVEEPRIADVMYAYRPQFSEALDQLVRTYATAAEGHRITVELRPQHVEILEWVAAQNNEPVERVVAMLVRQALLPIKPLYRDATGPQRAKTMSRDEFKTRQAAGDI